MYGFWMGHKTVWHNPQSRKHLPHAYSCDVIILSRGTCSDFSPFSDISLWETHHANHVMGLNSQRLWKLGSNLTPKNICNLISSPFDSNNFNLIRIWPWIALVIFTRNHFLRDLQGVKILFNAQFCHDWFRWGFRQNWHVLWNNQL